MSEHNQVSQPSMPLEYLNLLEERVARLEEIVAQLRTQKTQLTSEHFLDRAFAVWGHLFVANLIIAIPVFILMLLADMYL